MDGRTRHSHAVLDGEKAEKDKKFSNGCMFPGDPNGPASEIYNCRCTLIASMPDVDTSDVQRRARDPVTGESVLIEDMTYAEWAGWTEKNRKTVDISAKSATIKEKVADGEGARVQTIGKIDIEKYRCVSDRIRTDEVIITEERIQHIKERHPQDFERYSAYMSDIIEHPQYILEANKPSTAFLLKEYTGEGERIQLILRLAVEDDKPGYKNSVITFLRVEEKRFNRYLRTKKILYKSE